MATVTKYDCIIIGAGPAGLIASIYVALCGARTLLMEAGPRPGRKLLATGGGRCNLTHAGTAESLLEGFDTRRARFLKHAVHLFPPDDVMTFFEDSGVPLKTERGARVFSARDRSRDVLEALLLRARSSGVTMRTSLQAHSVARSNSDNGFTVATADRVFHSRALIVATGGLSMKRAGSYGDGYRFAESLGHTIEKPRSSLVPLITKESWPGTVAGLALKNVELTAYVPLKRIRRFGEMLFTHHGIGGPITLEISRHLTDILSENHGPVAVEINLKPALDEKTLDTRLLREIQNAPKRRLHSILITLMPSSLADVFTSWFGFDPETPASHISREERHRLRSLLHSIPLTVTAAAPIEEAMVTRGGVSLSEINPKTMGSKLVEGLFFAGEVIDADGDCGGYNLHMCWATGRLAGLSAGEYTIGRK